MMLLFCQKARLLNYEVTRISLTAALDEYRYAIKSIYVVKAYAFVSKEESFLGSFIDINPFIQTSFSLIPVDPCDIQIR